MAATIALLLTAVTACRPSARTEQKKTGAAASVSAQPSGVAPATVPKPSFTFSYNSQLSVGEQKLVARLSGRLARSERWSAGGRTFQTFQISEPQVQLSSGTQAGSSLDGVSQPFVLRVDGARPELGLSTLVSPGARQLLAGLVSALQFRPPPAAGEESWTCEEWDVSGIYTASYVRRPDGWLEKHKTKYVGEPAPLDVQNSAANLRLGADGELLEITLAEELRSAPVALESRTTLVLQPTNHTDPIVQSAMGRLPDGYDLLPINELGQPSAASVSNNSPEQPFASALAELVSSNRQAFDTPTMMAVTQRLRKHPDEVAEVLEGLAQHPEQAAALTSLLVAVDQPQAVAAVKHLLADEGQQVRVRVELLASLLLRGPVDVELVGIVNKLSSSSDQVVAVAAINVGGELLRRAAAKAIDITPQYESYANGAEHCSSTKECGAYVIGMSYIATDPALAFVRRHLTDPAAELRLAAIRSLEPVKDHRIDEWLVQALSRETAPNVRERAIKACGYRGSKTCAGALDEELGRAATATDRMTVLQALGNGRF
ncbi:MAG TPA: HEAT repeat domain-containing protein, partial [Polyangiaceae bacterium]|nr:HEAT repeat domain-containing protein [Polyangiaceae bacterium]